MYTWFSLLPHQLAPACSITTNSCSTTLLFRQWTATLLEVAGDPKHLGAEIGFSSVLHTWGQNLLHHPHVHCVIPAGGLSPDHQRWVHPRYAFFLPVKVLSRVFRLYLRCRPQAAVSQRRTLFARSAEAAELRRRPSLLSCAVCTVRTGWPARKAPFGGPAHVLQYLARYTHRVAISNHRLVNFADGKVTFRWKDYARGGKTRLMTLSAEEFLRCGFCCTGLPRGFVRIRFFKFLANRCRGPLLPDVQKITGRLIHVPTRNKSNCLATKPKAAWSLSSVAAAPMETIERLYRAGDLLQELAVQRSLVNSP